FVLRQVAVCLLAELREDRALALVHGDQPLLRVEAVHLDRREAGATAGVVDGPEDDEEREVVVLLDLRALAELARVLQRERVQVEGLLQQLEVGLAGIVDVEPEEDAVAQPRLDALGVDIRLDGSPGVDQMAGQGRPSVLPSPDDLRGAGGAQLRSAQPSAAYAWQSSVPMSRPR